MSDIHKDAGYVTSKRALEDAVRAHAEVVNEFSARESSEPRQQLIVVGWVLGIGVTWMNDDGEMYDDLLPETSERLMTFTRDGMAQALNDHFRFEEEGEDEDDD